jgi:hypothetical protein
MQAVRTTTVGKSANSIEVIHDAERCYGFLRHRLDGSRVPFEAWWSDDRFRDYFAGEFPTKEAAIAAVLSARSLGLAA